MRTILVENKQRHTMMKFTFWIVWVMLSLTPGLVMAQNSKTVYTCPMHPEVQQAGPGKCPKCGMALVKKNIKAKTPTPKPKPKPAPKPTAKPKPSQSQDPHAGHKMPAQTPQPSTKNDEGHANHQTEPAPESPGVIKAPPPHLVRYDLYVRDTMVPKIGSKGMRHAIAINGSIPAPTLYFNEGDTAEI